jgi:transcriptional regulator with XRE-family HTH domain
MNLESRTVYEAVVCALGSELRRIREKHGWPRVALVSRLGISEQTLWFYEHGQRNCTVARLLEWCQVLGVSAPEVLQAALLASSVDVEALRLRVDLHAVAADTSTEFESIVRWARNRLAAEPDGPGVVCLIPDALRELAAVVGCRHSTLVGYLTRFTPTVTPAGLEPTRPDISDLALSTANGRDTA